MITQYNIDLILATRLDRLDDNMCTLIRALIDVDGILGVWVLLDEKFGYWPNIQNARLFRATIARICEWLFGKNLEIRHIVFDLEPPIFITRSISRLRADLLHVFSYMKKCIKYHDKNILYFHEAADLVRSYGASVFVVVPDFLFEMDEKVAIEFSRILGIPVFDIGFDVISTMTYNSIIHGLFKVPYGVLRYRMYRVMRNCIEKYGAGYVPSIGAIWRGILGNEPIYSSPKEISRDVSIIKYLGINRVLVYNFEGILNRRNEGEWLGAMINTKPARPKESITYEIFRRIMKEHAKRIIDIFK